MTTTNTPTVTAADLVILPFTGPASYGQGYAAAYKADLTWVRNGQRKPLVRKSEAEARQAAFALLGLSATETETEERDEESSAQDAAMCEEMALYQAAVAKARATGQEQPLSPGETGRAVDGQGNILLSVTWLLEHAEPLEVEPESEPVAATEEATTPQPTPARPHLTSHDREVLALFADGLEHGTEHLGRLSWVASNAQKHVQKMVKRGFLTREQRGTKVIWTLVPAYATLAAECAAEAPETAE